MVALLDRGALASQIDERAAAGRAAANQLYASSEPRQLLAARIGSTQELIANTKAKNEAEKTTLSLTRADLVGIDFYDTSVRIKDLEARLDSFYTLTARLSQLRLTDYLR